MRLRMVNMISFCADSTQSVSTCQKREIEQLPFQVLDCTHHATESFKDFRLYIFYACHVSS